MILRTGHQLRVARVAANLTQDELAAGANTSRQTVVRYERMGPLPDGLYTRALSAYLLNTGMFTYLPSGTLLVEVPGA